MVTPFLAAAATVFSKALDLIRLGRSGFVTVMIAPIAIMGLAGCAQSTSTIGTLQPAASPTAPSEPSAVGNPARQPLQPDPGLVAAGRHACLGPDFPARPSLALAVQDRRLPDAAVLVYRQDEEEIVCFVRRQPDGTYGVEQESSGTPKVAGVNLAMTQQMALEPGAIIVGRVTPPIARVIVQTRRGLLFEASVANGEFAVWWVEADDPSRLIGLDVDGRFVSDEPIVNVP